MNAGRKATPIGGDAIHPYFDVRHSELAEVLSLLRSHRIEFLVRYSYIRLLESDDPGENYDRIDLPGADPQQVQKLLDSTQ